MGVIEPFSATLAPDGLAECDQPGKNPLKYSVVAGNRTRATGREDRQWAIPLSCHDWLMKQLRNMWMNLSGHKLFYQTNIKSILAYAAPVWHSFLSKYNLIEVERIQKPATKIICATGDLNLNYEQRLKAADMPSINDFLTEVCHKHFYKNFTNDKHPLFSRLTFNHRVSSRRQSCQSRCWTAKRQTEFFSAPNETF